MGGALTALGGCTSVETVAPADPSDGGLVREGSAVDGFPESSATTDGGSGGLSCAQYCTTVEANCVDNFRQYNSHAECMAFCAHWPEGQPGDKNTATLACRTYWAGNPSRTDPTTACFAAGPFGGNVCGDRCQTFCDTVLSACRADEGHAAFPSQPACADACEGFSYRDASIEGGGEAPTGPEAGDTLNCRLFHLREAVTSPALGCAKLRPDAGICVEIEKVEKEQ